MTEIGEILNDEVVEMMQKLGLDTPQAVASASDEDLLKISGIGPATLKKLRAWEEKPPVVEKKDAKEAVSLYCIVVRDGDERVTIQPGDVLPVDMAEKQVEKGRARWR